jgi:N-acetylglucosamine kinase-like BadF-type ATPase
MYHKSMHVIGIDAGGTKTVCLLAGADGVVLAEARGAGANLQAAGEFEVEKVLHAVMEEAIGDRPLRPDAICLGIAGVDRPADAAAVRGIMRRIGFKTRTLIVNDALVALAAGTDASMTTPGVVVIAGTGSIAYGTDGRGRAARAGGWGYLLGDEGGGYWLGRAALVAVVRQFDGRGPATELTELVLAGMDLASPAELIHAIYDNGLQRRTIASVAAIVQRAHDMGDAVATDIMKRAALELTTAAASVIERLELRGQAFRAVLAGGMFQGVPSLAADVMARLAEVAPRSEVRLLAVEPAVGAIRLALAAARGAVAVPAYI